MANKGWVKHQATSADVMVAGLHALRLLSLPACGLDAKRPWVLVRTAYRQEKDVQADLHLAGWATYLPMQRRWTGPARAKRRVNAPLFTGYLFAACLPDGDLAAPSGIDGVVAVRRRRDGDKPVIRFHTMLRLMIAEAGRGFDYTIERVKPPKGLLVVGDAVRAPDGPFAGFEGRVEEVLSKREVRVVLAMFGREVPVTFQASKLQALRAA